jgi:hypothetical protein
MKNLSLILLQNNGVVSSGSYLKAFFSQWQILIAIIFVAALIYAARKHSDL